MISTIVMKELTIQSVFTGRSFKSILFFILNFLILAILMLRFSRDLEAASDFKLFIY